MNNNSPNEKKETFNSSKAIYQKPDIISTLDNLKEILFSQPEKIRNISNEIKF